MISLGRWLVRCRVGRRFGQSAALCWAPWLCRSRMPQRVACRTTTVTAVVILVASRERAEGLALVHAAIPALPPARVAQAATAVARVANVPRRLRATLIPTEP